MSNPAPFPRRKTLHRLADLVTAGLMTQDQADAAQPVAARYAVAIPPIIADLLAGRDPQDPLMRQFIPGPAELDHTAVERADPIGDDSFSPVAGLVHRYPDRVLLKPILVCPVYCRFCFRRETVGDADATLSPEDLGRALAYIAAHPEIREVILTGGDPLMMTPERVAQLTQAVTKIGHVEVIRWHSRVPVAAPERVGPPLIRALTVADDLDWPGSVWLSVHVNHPDELTQQAEGAIRLLGRAGLALIAQTVLLKGVNDDALVLETLLRRLIRLGVKPYYLHHPDLAPGTGQFRLSIAQGQAIVQALRGRLSGLAQPTYVLDIPGGFGKVPLTHSHWDGTRIRDWQGGAHPYPDA